MPAIGSRVSRGFIFCVLVLPLLFFVGPALAANNTTNITTTADGAYGLLAESGGAWNNTASIVTQGDVAYGMWAISGSQIENSRRRSGIRWYMGSIATYGLGSHGMAADGGSQAWNSEAIHTFGPDAYGMLATGASQTWNEGVLGLSLSGLTIRRGSVVTEGTGSHGMVADGDGSIAWNAGNLSTYGIGADGMRAQNGGIVHNYAQQETSVSIPFVGTFSVSLPVTGVIQTASDDAGGMSAEGSGSQAWNPGSITTQGANAYGMAARDGGTAFNFDLAKIAWDLPNSLGGEGSLPVLPLTGRITTYGEGAHGMFAQGGSIAANAGLGLAGLADYLPEDSGISSGLLNFISGIGLYSGEIVTMGNNAYGMMATDTSLALNAGSIVTHGAGSYGMGATNLSLAANAGLGGAILPGTIETTGDNAIGMAAQGLSLAANAGGILTRGAGSHGMQAEDFSMAVNAGSLVSLAGGLLDMAPEGLLGDSDMSGLIGALMGEGGLSTVETFGPGAHGMLAKGNSFALNLDEIVTHGNDAFGMKAEDLSVALNMGSIATGVPFDGQQGENGQFQTTEILPAPGGMGSHGMAAQGTSAAFNAGSIVTYGDWASGMQAEGTSLAVNGGSAFELAGDLLGMLPGEWTEIGEIAGFLSPLLGEVGPSTIETFGVGSHGMTAMDYSIALNLDGIVTHGMGAYGMLASGNSLVLNLGTIATDGALPTGDDDDDMGIFQLGPVAHGMVAESGSAVVNLGQVGTSAEGAFGMLALGNSLAFNAGTVETFGTGAHGMVAEDTSMALNVAADTVETWGDGAHGMVASGLSAVLNTGSVITHGNNAYGMQAVDTSLAVNAGTVETWGERAYGMAAFGTSGAVNTDSVVTHGERGIGLYAHIGSLAVNSGSIATTGDKALGMRADETSALLNSGGILTEGSEAHGMDVAENSLAANTGTITTLGAGAHAAKVSDSTFVNAGTLDSAQGNAVQAENGSLVTLLDGTTLVGSRVLADDGTSSLAVLMDGNLAAQVDGFGNLVKAGEGTLLLESGSSAGNTLNLQGTLEIENGSRFLTGNFAQMPGAALYLYANPASATDFNAIPLWVEGDAFIRGGLTIDMANAASLPGIYTFIRAENYDADFETSFVNLDPLFTPYGPQWLTGGSWLYTSMVGYSFSESALGLVSAIQDWSLLRWVMGNHMADVAGGLVDLEDGARHYHFQGLYGKTERDPAGDSPAGFDAEQSGVSIGFDQKVNEQTAWGLYAGYTKNDLDITHVGPAKSDWEEQESWHLGGYVLHREGDWILTNALTYRATDHETFRKQMNGDATADFDSWSITNDFRVGNVVKEIGDGSNWEVVPEFGFNFGYINRDGYSEKNGFDYGDFDTTVWEGVLGIRFRGEFEQENGSKWVPNMRLSWVHTLSGDDVTVHQGWYGDWHSYTEELDDDYLVLDLGVSLFTAGDAQISLNYNGRFGDNSEFHGAWLRFMKTF